MNKSFLLRLSILFFLLMNHQGAFSSIDVYEFNDDKKRVEFVALTKELRCPKCQNQDIADSNAPIAADMRKEVHRLLLEGKDKDSIIDYMIDRFGEFVTYKPKKSSETFILWYGPLILVLIGILVILSLIKLNKKTNPEQLNASEELRQLLDKYDSDQK
ncbi:MAG: cytochrome c-type biogenesis protein CcmH [Oleiphilaceae bacterium]|jgi:cytochrome c-type biogenesis protein CcmH